MHLQRQPRLSRRGMLARCAARLEAGGVDVRVPECTWVRGGYTAESTHATGVAAGDLLPTNSLAVISLFNREGVPINGGVTTLA